MPRSRSRAALLVLFASAALGGCGADDETAAPGPAGPEDEATARASLALACDDPLDTFYDAVTPPAPWTDDHRGDVARCAYDRFVPAAEMQAHFVDNGYADPGIKTGAHKVRLLYWTERGPGDPRLTSATLYLPAERVADTAPLLVVGHGSVGIADLCAPSREDADGFHKDWRVQLYTLAGDGWPVIQPDFPGLGTPGPASWMHAPDEGHAMLDATRAARKAAKPGVFSAKNALIGHSNGGHAALAAQSYAKGYGSDGTIETTLVYAPFWLSNAAWGALLTPFGVTLINDTFFSMTLQYFYGHAAAYDGDDHALDGMLPDKGPLVRDFLEGACWQVVARDGTGPSSLGLTRGVDVFTAPYVDEVGLCGVNGTCETDLALTWKARWAADRPAPDPSIPIVLWQGAKDDFLTPGFQKCGIDRLEGQGASLQVCVDTEGDHSSVIPGSAVWVRQYLGEMLLGTEPPPPCTSIEALGADLKCTAPIPNSSDPGEP